MKKISLLFLFIISLQACTIHETAPVQREVTPPDWAPVYEDMHRPRYYYLPDIETYYDVYRHEYIYLEDGNWIFSYSLPPYYSGYNLYNGHIIVLDHRVNEPWHHHNLYLAHYPRYYYHSVYPTTPAKPERPRGYNENVRKPIYNNAPNSGRPAAPTRPGYPATTPSQPSEPSRSNTQPTRPAQPATYNSRNVGQPVKVNRGMTRPRK